MQAIWFPSFGAIPGILPELRRWVFYSFPHEPLENGEFRVLSSGTWGARGNYGNRNWQALYDYYRQYENRGNAEWRMMPDEYLDPRKTMQNFLKWMELYPDMSVVPIIQFTRKKYCDLYAIKKQIDFYRQYKPVKICISNPGFWCVEWVDNLIYVSSQIKDKLTSPWIHVLGAGWNIFDIKQYTKISSIDSVDNIIYYTEAKNGMAWCTSKDRSDIYTNIVCNCPACVSGVKGWKKIAMHNAYVAQEVVKYACTG